MLHGHGDDRHLYEAEIQADLSSNVRTEHFPQELPSVLQGHMDELLRYPEPNAESLQKDLAALHGVSKGQLLVTNGSIEAFYLIAHAFSDRKAVIPAPTFAEYEDACSAHGMKVERPDWKTVDEGTSLPEGLLYLCNPNNPDGKLRSPEKLAQLLQEAPQTTAAIDEANAELTPQPSSLLPYLQEFPNVILVRSLTKSFAIPGLRLGYILASEATIQKLLEKKMPWSVNTLALKAGQHLVREYGGAIDPERVQTLKAHCDRTWERIRDIEGFEPLPTDSSYFLVRMERGEASELKEYLVQEHGVLIRDACNFEGLDERYFRISVQDEEQDERLIEGLKAWKARS